MSKTITINKRKLNKMIQTAVEKELDRRKPKPLTQEQQYQAAKKGLDELFRNVRELNK
jgi:hypothetical protein